MFRVDAYGQALLALILDYESQVGDIVPVDVTSRAGERQVGTESSRRVLHIASDVSGALLLGVGSFVVKNIWYDIWCVIDGFRKSWGQGEWWRKLWRLS